MKKISKHKAINLIDEKIDLFEKIKSEAKYDMYFDNRYDDNYHLAYHGTIELLDSLFGENTGNKFKRNVSSIGIAFIGGQIDYLGDLNSYKEHITKCVAQLKIYKEKIINFWEDDKKESKKNEKVFTNKIFLVHGHNEEIKQSVARVLEKQNIEYIILHEKPNKGKTIIEKIENNSDVSASIILYTGDDYGYSRNEGSKFAKLRARQNVIFEMGFFIGTLRRENVICLYEEKIDIEILSDYKGVIYIPYDSKGIWKYDLGKELKEIGFNFDLNKI